MTARCTIGWSSCAANAASSACSSSAVPSSRARSRSLCRSPPGPTRGATIRPQQTAPVLDPIEATLALRATRPADRPASSSHLPTALPCRCDGEQRRSRTTMADGGPRRSPCARSAAHSARSPGRSSTPTSSSSTTTSYSFRSRARRSRVDAAVETDPERTVVRLAEPPDPGDRDRRSSPTSAPTPSDAIEHGTAARLVDESASESRRPRRRPRR